MRFARLGNSKRRPGKHHAAGFTLAEVLAALLFMAIVVPVAVQGLRIAALAAEVAERKTRAARIADRVLQEIVVMTNWSTSSQEGTVVEGTREYRWRSVCQQWEQTSTNVFSLTGGSGGTGRLLAVQPQVDQSAASQLNLYLLSVEVFYPVQSREYSVRLSTLLNSQQ